jgi:Calcineurin-like phosphoesterase
MRHRMEPPSHRRGMGVVAIATLLFVLAMATFLTLNFPHHAPLPSAVSQSPANQSKAPMNLPASGLLTDPFLQWPTVDSVRVVWFTAFPGITHTVFYGPAAQEKAVAATSVQLSRVREDKESKVSGTNYERVTPRPIWRHEAQVVSLRPGERVPYRVVSSKTAEERFTSRTFSLAPAPLPGQPAKILLTSDHQLMPMTAANLQKVQETIGQVDAVFLAGDLVNIPDRASEWFDDARGGAFFPCLQGLGHFTLDKAGRKTLYRGGELIQHAPLFPAVGNHEVMGRYTQDKPLNEQFNDPIPWAAAQSFYEPYASVFNPYNDGELKRRWLRDNSFNLDTYEEIFSLPTFKHASGELTKRYYAMTFGDIRLISLYVTQIWRVPDLNANRKGRYRERQADHNYPTQWGHGQHIFESITPGSPQYDWLKSELASDAFQQAKYRIVMFHHPVHTLGGNSVPAFTSPVRTFDRNSDGSLKAIRYEYPQDQDYIVRDLLPLLEAARVNLVFYGHSHLWNRFIGPTGIHFLESSNVGNTYGAYDSPANSRPVPTQAEAEGLEPFQETYVAVGDANGLTPVMPSIQPLKNDQGQPLPYLASNDMTAFSIFDTQDGQISSYYFDTREPDSAVVKFDQFSLE